MASTRPITFIKEVDIDKAMAAITDIEDYKAIIEALVTVKEVFVKDLVKVDFVIELNINKRSAIFVIRQNVS